MIRVLFFGQEGHVTREYLLAPELYNNVGDAMAWAARRVDENVVKVIVEKGGQS